MIDRLLDLLLRHRAAFLALVVASVILSCIGAAGIALRLDPAQYHDRDSPIYRDYERFLEAFGHDEGLAVVIELPDGLQPAGARGRLREATERLEALGWFERVISAATIEDLQRGPDGGMRLEPMLPDDEASAEAIEEAIARIIAHPLYGGGIIDPAGRYAVIQMLLWRDAYEAHDDEVLIDTIEREVRAVYPDAPLHLLGAVFVNLQLERAVRSDRTVLLAGVLIVAFLSLVLIVGEPRRVLILTTNVLVSVALTLGLFRLLDGGWTIASAIMPLVVAIYSLADSIHILAHFDRRLALTGDQRRAAVGAVRTLFTACCLTSVTTILGFLTLMLSPQVPIRELGMGVAAGIAAAFVIDVTLTPVLLSLVRLPRRDQERRRPVGWAAPRAALRRPKAMLAALLAITAVTALGLSQIRMETNVIGAFAPDNPAREGMRVFEEHLGGPMAYEVVLEGKEPGAFEDPERIDRLRALRAEVDAFPEVAHTLSFGELLDYYRALADVPQPETRADVAELLLLASFSRSGIGIYDYVDTEHRTARLTARTGYLGAETSTRLAARIEDRAAELFGAEVTARVTGSSVLFAGSITDLVRSFLRSLLLAVAVVSLVFFVMCGSLRWGLVFALPNVMAVLIAYAAMGLLDIELNFTTAVVGSVALGIAVDDTIHVLLRLKAAYRRGNRGLRAMVRALRESCTGITLTTLTLVAGLGVGMLSDLRHTVWLCGLLIVGVSAALVYNLLLVPALVRVLPLPPLAGPDGGAGGAAGARPAPAEERPLTAASR